MVSILKDIPIDGVKIVPCRVAMNNRGVVKSFLVAGENRVILVDTGASDADADIIMDAIKDMGHEHSDLKLCVLTHRHGDHTGGHPEFIKVAEIIAHRNNRANMIRSKLAAPPRVVFSDQAAVFLGGIEAQAIHFGRGHTNGDAVIYFPDLRTVHTGDLVVWGKRTDGTTLTPFVDRASGGSLAEWVTTLDGVLKLDFDTAIPGHGPVLTKDNVRTFHRNLVTLRQRITDVVKSGAKQEEFGAKLKTDDLGWPFPPERLKELWDEFGAGR